jgi:hypothetical protein
MRGRIAITGALAVAAYAVVALVGPSPFPQRPLYDGVHTQEPYVWVSPPPDANANGTPTNGTGKLKLDKDGSQAGTIATADPGTPQALAIFPSKAFPARAGETEVDITIAAIDPNTLAPPPSGMQYDSNAYAFTATYARSKQPAPLRVKNCTGDNQRLCATVALRFAFGAIQLVRFETTEWTNVASGHAGATLQIFASTPELGTYAAVVPKGTAEPKSSGVVGYLAALLGFVALVVALTISRRPGARKWFRKRYHRTRRVLKR